MRLITEQLTELWVTYNRYHCKNGYIDRCIIDSLLNPNDLFKTNAVSNVLETWYRLNKGTWQKKDKGFFSSIHTFRDVMSAEEIWNKQTK
jgi:hypothetical protein